jgi:hypothetical protein
MPQMVLIASPDGGWRVVDVWASREVFDQFLEKMESPRIESWQTHNLEL